MGAIATIPMRHGTAREVWRSSAAINYSTAEQVTKAWMYAETRARRIPRVPLGRYVRYRRFRSARSRQ